MLRTTANSIVRASSWKNPAVYSSVKYYSAEGDNKPSLSQRLGGTGRGKVLANPADPFASFLNNAKKTNNNNRRNGNFTPRPRKQQADKGQFEDAAEAKPKAARPTKQKSDGPTVRADKNNNNNNNNNNNRRQRNNNNNNNNKRMNLRRSQPQEVRTRRATTFINKDIDWTSFDTTTVSTTEAESVEETVENKELALKELQGDYDRYLAVGKEIQWADIVKVDNINNLVGSNPTLDLQQKTAFMAALSKATSGNALGARK